MDNLMNLTSDTTNMTSIEIALGIDEEGRTTAKRLYDFLELRSGDYARWCKRNITENQFAYENVDYWAFRINAERGGQATTDFKLTADFAKKLSMTAKSEKGEQARNYFVSVEEGAKQLVTGMNDLSPELQLMIKLEVTQKQQAADIKRVDDKLESIKGVLSLDSDNWRNDTANLFNKMAEVAGGYRYLRPLRKDSYDLLEHRMGVNIGTRLTNKRRRMAEEGVSKSRRDKVNKLDVIAEDKKLIEGYIAVVKDMAIKFGATQ